MAGITPACAGKTLIQIRSYQLARDHPRVCGENVFTVAAGSSVMGSPPRVRGKRRVLVDFDEPAGITPACAGKTPLRCRLSA